MDNVTKVKSNKTVVKHDKKSKGITDKTTEFKISKSVTNELTVEKSLVCEVVPIGISEIKAKVTVADPFQTTHDFGYESKRFLKTVLH